MRLLTFAIYDTVKLIFFLIPKVGQKAFHGITNLNRIQSVVFDAAYNTNENLLVCAPTGAGKTNVALLTIIHQIKQHIRNNEIHKNEFKVILLLYCYFSWVKKNIFPDSLCCSNESSRC